MKKFLFISLIFLFISVIMAINTSAYIDPSVMTYVIQIVAGVVIAGGAALTIYWKKIRLFFKKIFKKSGKNKIFSEK